MAESTKTIVKTAAVPESQDVILVRGARQHNLKNLSFAIPHNQITVVTGVSGSGKSSLAFDTIYAEGQRRYIESLSSYARQFLERIEKPDVDEITGIAPAIAIRQKNSTRNPRSTVATATEIYDYLRLLYARVGKTLCTNCGSEVRRDSMDEIAARVLALPAGRRFSDCCTCCSLATAPSPAAKEARRKPKGPAAKLCAPRLRNCRSADSTAFIKTGACLNFPRRKLCWKWISRSRYLCWWIGFRFRLNRVRGWWTPWKFATAKAGGEAILEFAPDEWEQRSNRLIFNERFECKKCGIVYQEPEPRLFSFNNPAGACPRCQGFGNTIDFDLNLVIPDPAKSHGRWRD